MLRSQTVFRMADGHLMGWEGVFDRHGSCWGSCTHVWNYESATAHLFGDLSRTMRDVEFNHALKPNGAMAFRAWTDMAHAADRCGPAADGQMGTVMRAYRDWLLSGDDAWLKSLWPNIRRALAFAWSKDGEFNTSDDCPYAGHIDFSTYDTTYSPGQNCADDLTSLGNTLNGRTIGRYIAGWGAGRNDSPYLWDAEYQTMGGWHRLGFRYHQEAAINEGTVVYTGYTELYIDGVLCWRVHSNFHPTHKDSLITKGVLPWSATIDPEDPTKLVYTNNDHITVEMRIDTITSSSQSVFICVDDINWTCGDGFVTDVVRVENPTPAKVTLPDGNEYDAAMYYTKAPID